MGSSLGAWSLILDRTVNKIAPKQDKKRWMIPRLKEKILLQDILQRTNENNVNEIIIIMNIITIIITIIFIHVILSQGTPRILPNCLRKKRTLLS